MMISPSFLKFKRFLLWTTIWFFALTAAEATDKLDFGDPEVSIFEMRRTLALKMIDDPIPQFVMDDTVRKFEPTEKDTYFTVKNGRYQTQIFGNGIESLREFERQKLAEFHTWLNEKGLKLPKGFDQNLEELRVMACRDFDFQRSYDTIWEHD